jgi:hypothetical protein
MADLKYTSNGADFTTYQLNPYLKNRLKYHAASRLASQTGEGLGQALNVDGHIVTSNKIWAAPQTAFPNNADKNNVDPFDATNDLVDVFKTQLYDLTKDTTFLADVEYFVEVDGKYTLESVVVGEEIPIDKKYYVKSNTITSESFWNGTNSKVWTNSKYPAVRLYENVPMTTVKGSDGGGKFQSYEVLDQNFILTTDLKFQKDKKYYKCS